MRPLRLISLLLPLALLLACTDGLTPSKPTTPPSLEAAGGALDAAGGSMFLSVKADGQWSLRVEEGADWASVSPSTGEGSRNSVVLTYASNTGFTPRTLFLLLETGDGSARLSLTQSAKTIPGGQVPGGGEIPGQGTAMALPTWLELPATDATDGLDFFARDCTLGGKKMRNYAFYWDYTARVSHWVAYPLTSAYMGSSGRSEEWGYDPLLPAAKQQNVSGGYREGNNGWYARGHQIPSADRTADKSLNATTFYGTNMTPQNNDFNGGVWSTLEGKVRSWAGSSDTLYVVTGCVVEGAKYYVIDRSGNKITVPTAYFKAVLRYKKDSTVGQNGYMAAGFWYDHEGYPNTFSNKESMSIDDLEKKLGYELFVNLSGVVGESAAASIKSEKPASNNWWWQ